MILKIVQNGQKLGKFKLLLKILNNTQIIKNNGKYRLCWY